MVELISKVSKGSRMDQIYIPKKRPDFSIGSYVIIKQLETQKKYIKPFFYHIKYLEPIKIEIIKKIFKILDSNITSDNIIITGSFLDIGFRFNDVDIIIVAEGIADKKSVQESLKDNIGVKAHLIVITNKSLIKGISTDPLYRIMLSRCVSKKRLIYKSKPIINYKLLDLHLLKNSLLIDNFYLLNGDEKYELIRNLVAINQFINKKEITAIDLRINALFGRGTAEKLKNNTLSKKDFLNKYQKIYNDTKYKILEGINHGAKQKQTD